MVVSISYRKRLHNKSSKLTSTPHLELSNCAHNTLHVAVVVLDASLAGIPIPAGGRLRQQAHILAAMLCNAMAVLPQVDAAVAPARHKHVPILRQVLGGPNSRFVRPLDQRLVASLGVVTAREE
jgi:hypothetical protein